MLGQIVEISNPGQRLSLYRGLLRVDNADGHVGDVPLDDIEAVIASTPALTYSNQLIAALAEHGAPLVICSPRFEPAAVLLPLSGHYAQGTRFEAQAAAARPTAKRVWAQIVKAKVRSQAAALAEFSGSPLVLETLARRVRSGDPDNIEAQAAQKYWPALFGSDFRRDRSADGTNVFLNYGYTVLRASTARAIVAAGLHPSLSLHHKSAGNSLRLADDLMEPFRPAVDVIVKELRDEDVIELTPAIKRRLAAVLHSDYETDAGVSTLSTVLVRCAQSLAQVYLGERRDLMFPLSPLPLHEDAAARLAIGAGDASEI
ncbi:MAG: type II CRISPR-associated endonuclease Cas1 [Alphaproteobacteria bacterium]|nr:type II CRISPR-associated endonuclease Cas1 [Alphaproteobacteria bacterium]